MEIRNIETLHINPDNNRILKQEGKDLLLYGMSMGDHSTFLITPEGMTIDGNNRWFLRNEAGWDNKDVYCRILTYGQEQAKVENGEDSYYAIIDGAIVRDHEVIPHYYVSVEALYKAYSLTRNGEAAYDDPEYIANNFHNWKLDPQKFQVHFFPPASIEESLKNMEKAAAKKKYQLIIMCTDEADMDSKFSLVSTLGIIPKRKI